MLECVTSYLLDEGYTNDINGAIKIVSVMSEEWLDNILSEAKFKHGTYKFPLSPHNIKTAERIIKLSTAIKEPVESNELPTRLGQNKPKLPRRSGRTTNLSDVKFT